VEAVQGVPLVLGEDEERFLTLQMEEAQRLEGVVIDRGGFLIPGASISARDVSGSWKRGSSASDGSFSIDGLAPGPVRVRVRASGYLDEDLRDIDPSYGPIEVVMRTSYTLRGVVVDGETGEPINRANVRSDLTESRGRNRSDRTNRAGEFELEDLTEGQWRLRASADGFIAQNAGTFQLPFADPNTLIIIEMQPGARVIGVVVDMAGMAISGADVRAYLLIPEGGQTREKMAASPSMASLMEISTSMFSTPSTSRGRRRSPSDISIRAPTCGFFSKRARW